MWNKNTLAFFKKMAILQLFEEAKITIKYQTECTELIKS